MANVNFKYRYNSDDIFHRAVFAALTETLTKRASYKQIESDTVMRSITVPFLLRATGDERFLQYHFSGDNHEKCEERYYEGSFDVIPRGVLSLTGFNIDRAQLTSKYARANYYEIDDDGNIKQFSAEIAAIPHAISFQLKIIGDTINEVMKIYQNLLETFYFNQKFNFLYKGIVCHGNANFPDSVPLEGKQYEFSYGSSGDKPFLICALDVTTAIPVISQKTKFGRDKVIKKFENSIEFGEEYEDFNVELTGRLSGTLSYMSNSSQYTGNVSLYDRKNNYIATTTPDIDGEYLFVNVPAKINYKLKDSANVVIATGINVIPGLSNSVDVEIEG